jgi:formyltetrahydrofolate deformylase
VIHDLPPASVPALRSCAVTTHLLRIACPDEIGLIYRITSVLFHHGFNIISNHEFVDPATRHFFMRTAFAGAGDPQAVVTEIRQILPAATIRLAPDGKRPVVLLATKESHCVGDLLLRHAAGELPAQIRAVVSNHSTLAPLVQQFGIPFHHVTHHDRDRADHEQAIRAIVDEYQPDYLVLAKYMRVLSPAFVARYAQRILNIHHSFLPAFVGARPYHQAFERGVKIIGATAHFVTDDLDTGPIIAQDVLPINHSYTAAAMVQAGRDIEKLVLARALRLVLEERVFIHHNRTIVFD